MMIMIRRGRETGSMLIERQGKQHEVFVLSASYLEGSQRIKKGAPRHVPYVAIRHQVREGLDHMAVMNRYMHERMGGYCHDGIGI